MRLVILLILIPSVHASACQTVAVYPDSQNGWVEDFRQGPFHFQAQFPIKRPPLLRDLQQIRQELEQQLKIRVGNDPIEVKLFKDWPTYRAFMKANIASGANRRALFVKGPNASYVYAYRSNSFDTDVRHECTHAMIHNAVPFIPLWLDEGLAEYFEIKAGNRTQAPKLTTVHRSLFGWSRRAMTSLESLERLENIQHMGQQEYQDSWAWVHFLLNDTTGNYRARGVLVQYLGQIQKGEPPGPFSRYLAKHIPDNPNRLVQHFRYFPRTTR